MIRRKRGKAFISSIPSHKSLMTKDTNCTTKANEILKPIVLLSLLVGYVPRHFQVRGLFGGLVWLLSLILNGAFNFLSARKRYGYAWASIQILLFVNLAMCTYSIKGSVLPWLELGIGQLEKENKYLKTFARIRKLFRIIPWVVILFSVCSTSLLYFCFYYDDAFSVTFEQTVSQRWNIAFHVLWFMTNVHTLYGFALFWCIGMCNMYAVGYSMTEYHEMMTAHLKNKETPITFRQAVHSFAERGKFLKKSASACRVSLAFLLIYSIASLAVNAFYYLYKTRRAAYVFFALVPPICSVYPLCLAAWVTKQYKWYLSVVVKAWAERPDSTDEDEESGSDHVQSTKDKQKSYARKFTKRVKSAKIKKEEKGDTNRRRSLFTLRQTRSNPISANSYSDSENRDGKNSSAKLSPYKDKTNRRRSLFPLRQTRSNPISARSHSDTESQDVKISFDEHPREKITSPTTNKHITFANVSSTENAKDDLQEENLYQNDIMTMDTLMPFDPRQSISEGEAHTDDERKPKTIEDGEKNIESKVSRQRVMELILRGTARAVGRLQHRVKLPKFNFEKYISYLQNVLPTIGFKIMGITVTWNMVSTLLFLEVSLLALFVQESIFGNQTAKVSL